MPMNDDGRGDGHEDRIVALEFAVELLIGLLQSLKGPELEEALRQFRRRASAEATRDIRVPPSSDGYRRLTRLIGLFEASEVQTPADILVDLFEDEGGSARGT